MAVLEAMACALPIIATRVGGLPELVLDGENGFLTDPGNIDQMAEGVLRICRDSRLWSAMAHRSYQIVSERYDLEAHVQHLEEIYKLTMVIQR